MNSRGCQRPPPGVHSALTPGDFLPDRWLARHPQHRWQIADLRARERTSAPPKAACDTPWSSQRAYDVWAYLKDVLDQLLAGSTDYESLRPDVWKQSHPESVRSYRDQERRDRADRKQRRRARRRRKPR